MHRIGILRLGRTALLAGFVAGGLAASTNLIVTPAHPQASAGVSVGADFHVALEPYGAWRHHRRFGDVWVPANRARDWRPSPVAPDRSSRSSSAAGATCGGFRAAGPSASCGAARHGRGSPARRAGPKKTSMSLKAPEPLKLRTGGGSAARFFSQRERFQDAEQ